MVNLYFVMLWNECILDEKYELDWIKLRIVKWCWMDGWMGEFIILGCFILLIIL